jgi:hypothetical protein
MKYSYVLLWAKMHMIHQLLWPGKILAHYGAVCRGHKALLLFWMQNQSIGCNVDLKFRISFLDQKGWDKVLICLVWPKCTWYIRCCDQVKYWHIMGLYAGAIKLHCSFVRKYRNPGCRVNMTCWIAAFDQEVWDQVLKCPVASRNAHDTLVVVTK